MADERAADGRDVAALVGATALNLHRLLADEDLPQPVAVPEALHGYEVESATAADYDHLLDAVVG